PPMVSVNTNTLSMISTPHMLLVKLLLRNEYPFGNEMMPVLGNSSPALGVATNQDPLEKKRLQQGSQSARKSLHIKSQSPRPSVQKGGPQQHVDLRPLWVSF